MKISKFIILLLLSSQTLFSQKVDSLLFANANLDINHIKARIIANGNLFALKNFGGSYTTGYEYPIGSEKHTFFNSSLWIGGFNANEDLKLAGEIYNFIGHDYWTGPLSVKNGSVSCSDSVTNHWNKVWKISKGQINYHNQHYKDNGYQPMNEIATWPAHGDTDNDQASMLAPFVDVNNDQIYNPFDGDYPLIKGDQSIFFIFNDVRNHTESSGFQLGIEIHGMAYAFNRTGNDALNNTIFVNYKIFNRSRFDYHNAFVGVFADIDIGNYLDDYFATDVQKGAVYIYNGDLFDEGDYGYGNNPPAQAMAILAGSYMDANDIDDPSDSCNEAINGIGFGDEIIDNERFGMTASRQFYNVDNIYGKPLIAEEYYNVLNSKYLDGSERKIQCTDSSGYVNFKFDFPAGSDSCSWGVNGESCPKYQNWCEETGNGGNPNSPGDRSGLAISGPFTFKANSLQIIDLAYVSAYDSLGLGSVALIKTYLSQIINDFKLNPNEFGDYHVGIDEQYNELEALYIYPNPATYLIKFSMTFNEQSSYEIFDLYGRKIMKGDLTSNSLDISGLKNGFYNLMILSGHNRQIVKFIKQ